jgi:hypothetical protein
MEIIERDGIIYLHGKLVTALDTFVSSVVRIIEVNTDYVIVSGYVAILFGRARGTEDVDLLIPPQTKEQFHRLWDSLVSSGFYFLNSRNENEIFSMLVDGLGVRIAKEPRIIPNMELKFEKTRCDAYALEKHRSVLFDDYCFRISPIELQIAYKIYLGSEKDIEDALYLWEIFRESLDTSTLRSCMELLDVSGEPYGIGS